MEIPKERPPDDNEMASEIGVTAAAAVLVFFTVILRYLGRWVLHKRVENGKGKSGETVLGWDDRIVFNVISTVLFFSLVAAVCVAIERGMGTHANLILYERGVKGLSDYNQAVFVCSIFYNSVLGFIKMSVLSLYQRILRGVQSQMLRTLVWVVFGIVAANTIINVLLCIFQCWPIKAAWDITITEKRCIDVNAFYLGNAITGVTTDAVVYLLSIPIVKPLQMDSKTKLQLLATMLIGGFAVVTSAVRLGFMPALLSDPDVSMAMSIPMNWSVAEPAVGILVSSMPAIRAIRFLWRKPGDDSYGSGAAQSTLRSRNGQIQLYEMQKNLKGDVEGTKARDADNDSEEQLVVGSFGMGKISRTTELEVSYSSAK